MKYKIIIDYIFFVSENVRVSHNVVVALSKTGLRIKSKPKKNYKKFIPYLAVEFANLLAKPEH